MGSTSRAREIARSTCLSGGIGFAFAAVLAATASAATPPFSYGGLNWEVDRYNADNYTFPVSYQGRTDVMQIDLGPNGYADNRPGPFTSQFYSTQGIKAATGLPGGEGFVSVDLFVPAAWNFNATSTVDGSHQGNNYGNFTSVGLWGQINDSSAVTQGFPILRFRNAGEVAGNYIYGWNDNLGQNIPSAGAVVNYNGWNTFRIEYRGDSYRYYLNGVLVAQQTLVNGSGQTLVDDPGNSLAYIFLNATNNNVSPESFRWSALQYGLIAITGENQNLNANLVGSVEAENTGTMNIGAGAQRRPQARLLDQEPGPEADRERREDDEAAVVGQDHEAEVGRAAQKFGHRIALARDAELIAKDTLGDQREAEGEQQAVDRIDLVEVLEQGALDHGAQRTDDEGGDEQRGPEIDPEAVHADPGDVGDEPPDPRIHDRLGVIDRQ